MRALLLLLIMMAGAARADGEALVVNNCLACHSRELLQQQRLTPKQWTAVVKKMVGWGAQVEPENLDALVAHLAAAAQKSWQPRTISADEAEAQLAPLPDGRWHGGKPARGQAVYKLACAQCHGADGRGTPTGMNLVDRPLLYRAPDFAQVVKKGRGRMPAFPLPDRDVAAMLAWLRTLEGP